MTVRQLIIKVLEGALLNLDSQLTLRIVSRDAKGYVAAIKHVPVERFFGRGELVVEQSDVDAAKLEAP